MNDARAGELKAFLRKMRGRIDPGDAGLPPAARRRRTSGLRVEEVASLAGVSLTWYSALEGGKDIRVSRKLLDRLAEALRLSAEEREYLDALARPHRVSGAVEWADDPALQVVVDGFTAGPALVIDRWWEIRAYNPAADIVYRLGATPEKNLLVRMFLDPYLRELHGEWERIAREMVAILHLSFAGASEDRKTHEVLSRLRAASPEFALWWDDFTLRRLHTISTTLNHPELGPLALTYARFIASPLEANGDRVVVVLQPPADEATRLRLGSLA